MQLNKTPALKTDFKSSSYRPREEKKPKGVQSAAVQAFLKKQADEEKQKGVLIYIIDSFFVRYLWAQYCYQGMLQKPLTGNSYSIGSFSIDNCINCQVVILIYVYVVFFLIPAEEAKRKKAALIAARVEANTAKTARAMASRTKDNLKVCMFSNKLLSWHLEALTLHFNWFIVLSVHGIS